MKYIKKFEQHSDYEAFMGGVEYVTPNVSYCVNEDEVHYNPIESYDPILKFTAEQANSTIQLNRIGTETTFANSVFQYSINNGEWHDVVFSSTTVYTIYVEDGSEIVLTESELEEQYNGDIDYALEQLLGMYYDIATNATGDTITLENVGDSVKFKGTNTTLGVNSVNYHQFVMTGKIKATGDITSLFNEVGGDMVMPSYGCGYLFKGCSSLTTAPELPSTTLGSYCYAFMFQGCTSLTTATSILPAITLAGYCYQNMFRECTSLTEAPELPATTLANGCYMSMFQGCTSLTTAPSILPAITLANNCYQFMFQGCASLTAAPELPATTLATNCYYYMFSLCTSLTAAPELPATTLANKCYTFMFQGCSNLNYIKALFTTTPSNTYTQNWVLGVKSTGTFVKNSSATWNVTGVNGIPTRWTVQTASV